jgi:hypothetical protein
MILRAAVALPPPSLVTRRVFGEKRKQRLFVRRADCREKFFD